MIKNYNKLIKYLESVKQKPFDWSNHNCCTFVNAGLLAFTDKNYMPEIKEKYHDIDSAIKIIKSTASKTLYHNLTHIFGKPTNIASAKRGNIIYKNNGLEGPSIGLCWGNISYFVGDKGLKEINTMECKFTWAAR